MEVSQQDELARFVLRSIVGGDTHIMTSILPASYTSVEQLQALTVRFAQRGIAALIVPAEHTQGFHRVYMARMPE